MQVKPNPGSDDARALGCTCPVLDNARGKGYMCIEGIFVYSGGCPVHAAEIKIIEQGLSDADWAESKPERE